MSFADSVLHHDDIVDGRFRFLLATSFCSESHINKHHASLLFTAYVALALALMPPLQTGVCKLLAKRDRSGEVRTLLIINISLTLTVIYFFYLFISDLCNSNDKSLI